MDTVRGGFIFVMSPVLGCRPARGHLVACVHLSTPNPSIHRQIGFHPLLLVSMSMVEFECQRGL